MDNIQHFSGLNPQNKRGRKKGKGEENKREKSLDSSDSFIEGKIILMESIGKNKELGS